MILDRGLRPLFSFGATLTPDRIRYRPNPLSRMPEVENLDRPRKMLRRELPDPQRSISQNDHFLRPRYSPCYGLSVQPYSKIWLFREFDDRRWGGTGRHRGMSMRRPGV